MTRSFRIALVQQAASPDRAANVDRGVRRVREAAAAGASLVSFAELAFERFYPQHRAAPCLAAAGLADVAALAEPIPGPTTDAFAAVAKEAGVVVAINLFERADGGTFDTSVLVERDGSLVGRTRMVHITDYEGFHEQDYYTPGDTGAPVVDTSLGRIGIAICYDRHYPEYMRALGVAGAELVLVPQAGVVGEWPDGLYEAELRVAAFQNGYWAALTNRVGREDGLHFAGESFVCSPDGTVTTRGGAADEVVFAEIDPSRVTRSHARRLFFRDRRPSEYRAWLDSDTDSGPAASS